MKEFLLNAFKTIFGKSLLKTMIKNFSLPLIPFYHTISDREIPHLKYAHKYRNWSKFKSDVFFLTKYFKSASSIDELLNDKNSFMLTFDDGLAECYEISKYLKHHNIQAIFFICSDFIDNKEMMYVHKISLLLYVYDKLDYSEQLILNKKCYSLGILNSNAFREEISSLTYQQKFVLDQLAEIMEVNFADYLKNEEPYLTSAQINEMIKDGFYIGAHSLDHPYFHLLNEDEIIFQMDNSLKFLDKYNINYKYFAFPFSFNDSLISQNLRENIFGKLADCTFGTRGFGKKNTSTFIQRFCLDSLEESFESFLIRSLMGHYIRKVRIKIKTIKK